ncbi:nitroreductase family deazaflavin-dependent oxidoreductase [Actinoplanes sp. LDG1-01]|uniref:Nitroreductase family deazaflavin-dependent oxidoreductase n=1 Tax=Paractinoplanes lichenicola TaxID=2802976 RepID=A0ABS1VXH1_9ACTN|nr:nitroreductase family deazaflavin-dependent oxidoreductase [Actinoplanes lichenicola]
MMSGRVRKGGRMMGFNVLVLTTVGRRSGAERANPVGWFAAPDGSKLIVASANGAADNPAWYYNLAVHPDVRIEVDGRVEEVTAEQLHGDEREQAWRAIVAEAPRFAQYETKTDRELPIIRLRSRGATAAP